jgi:D-glycero-D-manno-heptose 1,7-bisphosphate phosphatase
LGICPNPWIRPRAASRQVAEVFPHPAIVSLFGLDKTLKYKSRPGRAYDQRWAELSRLRDYLAGLSTADPPLHLTPELHQLSIEGQRGRAFKAIEDRLDAIVCAYAVRYAWHHGPRGYAVYGDTQAGHILVPMTPTMWQRIKTPRLLLLDRDGTLNRSLGDRPPNRPDEVELLPGVAARLHHQAALGWRLAVITNQGGVAYGYLTEAQAHAIQNAVLETLPVPVDASYLCPHHPAGTIARYAIDCPNRKPAPGAILQALARFEAQAADCLFVGDQDSDCQAAQAAGVPFVWAWDFFGWEPSEPPPP